MAQISGNDNLKKIIQCLVSHIEVGFDLPQHTINRIFFSYHVSEPIFFIDINPVQKAKEGETAHIKCKVKGNPVPKITWYFQGQQRKFELLFNYLYISLDYF